MLDGVRKLYKEKGEIEAKLASMGRYDSHRPALEQELEQLKKKLEAVDPPPRGIGPGPNHPGNIGGG